MGKYNFDIVPDRTSQDSLKWDIKPGELPMWVADMDFDCPPKVKNAILNRVASGTFGYSIVPDDWNKAYVSWWNRRYNLQVPPEALAFSNGVICSLSSIVRKLTTPGQKICVLTPVYNIFFNSIINNGRRPVECQLVYENGEYSIDFEKLDHMLSDPEVSMMIFCNPHNPIGKIWSTEELQMVIELCRKNHIILVSDEIHCDLTDPGKRYIPMAKAMKSVPSCDLISLWAPSKTFNMAGIMTSAIMIEDEHIRQLVVRGINTDEVAEPNVFAVRATIVAYNESEDWLEELRNYLFLNKETASEFLRNRIPAVHLVPSDATYLLWLDVSAFTDDSENFAQEIRDKTGLWLSSGSVYHGNGNHFLRMNIACPTSRVKEGLVRLKKALS